jgi:dihydrolipoyl dehydrogenase
MVMGELIQETEILVIGSGPGGYAAAFRAADLGMDVAMVDTAERPGGVCLFQGCIPSKTFLYLAELILDAGRSSAMGVTFERPRIDIEAVRAWKADVIDRLAGGLVRLSDRRGVQRIKGRAVFNGLDTVRIQGGDVSGIRFQHAIIATGSQTIPLPGMAFKPGGRVMDSTGALALQDVPHSLLVVGGGYVGLELGTVYAALGSEIHLVELGPRILPGLDADLAKPLSRSLDKIFTTIQPNTRVSKINERDGGVDVTLETTDATTTKQFDRVLVAIGRKPDTDGLGLEKANIELDEHGFIRVDEQMRTTGNGIFAVGDVVGGMMLAHKASYEGKIAAEVIAGRPAAFDARAIPAVVYTDPQIAWCGITEEEARQKNLDIKVQRFPWKFSGRAMTMGATDGLTKIIVDSASQRILGVGVVGRDAEGLIAEAVLAIEMGALAEDVALSIHAHPTLSETEAEVAEGILGSATHMLVKR